MCVRERVNWGYIERRRLVLPEEREKCVCVCVTCVAPKKEKLDRCVRKGKSQKLRDLRMNGLKTKEGREAGLVVSRFCDYSPSCVS